MAVDTFNMIPHGTVITGSGATAPGIPIAQGSMLEIDIDVTAQTGITAMSAYVEASNDGGAKWYVEPATLICKDNRHITPAAAEGTQRQNAPNIINNESTSAVVARWTAIYANFPGEQFRLRHFFTGTNLTWGVDGAIK